MRHRRLRRREGHPRHTAISSFAFMRLPVITFIVLTGALAASRHSVDTSSATSSSNPPVLENRSRTPGTVEATLTAAPGKLALVPGTMTDVYAFNGRVPGPTLEVREGDHVVVHYRNALPEAPTICWHGIHLPANQDGSPFDPVPPGAQRDYVFTLASGSAGTYWYHPHADMRTGRQVAMGYTDFAGKGMYHCHILDHEDHGMMGVLELKP